MRDTGLLNRLPQRLAVLRSLLWREWRDVRGVSLFCFALLPVAAWAIQGMLVHFAYPSTTASELVPVLVLLYGLLLAGDLFAREIESDRLAGLAALPVGLGFVWTAKVLLLAAQLTAFAAWTVGVHWVLFRLGGDVEATERFAEGLALAADSVPLVAACVAATLLYSTLWRRGLAAIVCGVGTAVGLAAALAATDTGFRAADLFRLPTGGMVASFLAATAAAFVLGRPHHARRSRRLGVAACVTLVGLSFTAAPVLARLGEARVASPENAEFRIHSLSHRGPDGRFVLSATFRAWRRGSDEAGTNPEARYLVGTVRNFLFDPETEQLQGPIDGSWNEWVAGGGQVFEDWLGFRMQDPVTGESRRVSRREAERLRREAEARREPEPEAPEPWWGGSGLERFRARGNLVSWTVRWLERGIERKFTEVKGLTFMSAVPGRVLVQHGDGRCEFVDLADDRRTVLYEPVDGVHARVSHVGQDLVRVSPRGGGLDRLYSVHDGRQVGPALASFRSCLVSRESSLEAMVADVEAGVVWRVVTDESDEPRVRLEAVPALAGLAPTYGIEHPNGLYFLDEDRTALWLLEPGASRPRAVLRVGEETDR